MTEMCNTGIKREFYGLSEDVQCKKVRPLIKSMDWSKWDWADFVYAHLKSNFKFRGCLRPIWPPKSNISSNLFKYYKTKVFCIISLLRGHFSIDLILLLKLGIL